MIMGVRLLLAVVFLSSGVTKLVAPRQFARDVQQYRILPPRASKGFGLMLPFVEIAVAVSFLTGYFTSWAEMVAAFLIVCFITAVATAMRKGLNLSCSCFGLLYRERVGWITQVRDFFLLLLVASVYFFEKEPRTLFGMFRTLDEPLSIAGMGLSLAAVVFVGYVFRISVKGTRRRLERAREHGFSLASD
ncbi:MAG: DoxX family membrane protein [SAR202 cluster bacterium]|nr:DoxX family membrane protein [SAR202 cluster bacterium]